MQRGIEDKFRFTGEALDPGTGLYYLRARYYDPHDRPLYSKRIRVNRPEMAIHIPTIVQL